MKPKWVIFGTLDADEFKYKTRALKGDVQYLKYILCVGESEEDVLSILQKRRDYLNNYSANVRALEIVNEIENM